METCNQKEGANKNGKIVEMDCHNFYAKNNNNVDVFMLACEW